MGKALQIRVTAVTWNPDLVEELWPRLEGLAASIPSCPPYGGGVMELVRVLHEGSRFQKWPEARKAAMGEGIRKAAQLRKDIEEALADWDPRKANALSDRLEDELDELERVFVA